MTTKATSATVDTSSNPGLVRIELFGGLLFAMPQDRISLETGSNKFGRVYIESVLSPTEVLIKNPGGIVDEVGTAITDSDLIITLENEETKDFHRRRWDLRDYYIYS